MSATNDSFFLARLSEMHAVDDDRDVYCTIHKEESDPPKPPHRPTECTYMAFQAAYDHFNQELFNGLLCGCLITLPRRNRRTLGYFWAQRFAEIGGTDRTDEIALNPQHFLHRPMRETLATLVHEMVHLWQQHHGKSGRGRYHNKEWGTKMKQVGLYPSNTGKPGGREVGQQMMHYVIEGGAFAVAFEALASGGFRIAWGELIDRIDVVNVGENRSNRVKYTCPACDDVSVWGRQDLHLICGGCRVALRSPRIW